MGHPGAASEDSQTAGAAHPGSSGRGHHDSRETGHGVPPSGDGSVFANFDGQRGGEAASFDFRA